MITIKDAYEIVMKNAIGDHAKGVGKVYDIGDRWLFSEKYDKPVYGGCMFAVRKSDGDCRLFSLWHPLNYDIVMNMKEIDISDII